MSFIIYALPRSRTAWLARFLTYGDWFCGHDEARHLRSMEDVKSWLSMDNTGTVETAAAPFWRTVHRPDVRVAVVRRPIEEVLASLERVTGPVDVAAVTRMLKRADRKLDQIEHRTGCLSVSYADLLTEEGCARLFEHCLPYKHDHAWWAALAPLNVQVNFPASVRHYFAHEPQIKRMAAQAKVLTLAEFDRTRQFHEPDELSIKEDTFDNFYRDCQHLFAEHLTKVGEAPDNFERKNLDLYRKLETAGALQVMVARCNGKAFGYRVTLVSQSLDDPNTTSAFPTTHFASPAFPGLGRQLQRASQAALRAHGVTEAFLHAGSRGDGPRLGPIYERMGAVEHGRLYRLKL